MKALHFGFLTVVVLALCYDGANGYPEHVPGYARNDEYSDSRLLDHVKELLANFEDENEEEETTQESEDNLLSDIIARFQMIYTDYKPRSKAVSNEAKVAAFLKTHQKKLHAWTRKSALAMWAKETNLTDYNIKASEEESLKFSAWDKKQRLLALKFGKNGLTYDEKRMLHFITDTSALNEINLEKLNVKLQAKISKTYSDAKVCNETSKKCFKFEPGLIHIMATSRDYDQLKWAWKGWRDAIGPKIRSDWIHSIALENKGAREHGHDDIGEYRRSKYEDPTFEKEIDELWADLEPYYKELHAFIRYRLHQQYGDHVHPDKPIPAHLLGDMWAMKWDNILDLVQPYPQVAGFDVTGGMKKQNITVHRMFTLADEFYRSLGLPKMTKQFWENSMFTRPKDGRPVVCYASASNLGDDDVRIKMCAVVTSTYLYVVHHEMGHCQYYLAYNRKQPPLYQSGANGGFHEAIGDTAALAVISPTHLEKLNILEATDSNDPERNKKDLNFLMQKALGKFAFYPYALTMSKYFWDVASGKITNTDLNKKWWEYRKKYQGITPPVARSEADFDAGSKYHIANFVPYIRYFVSHILQFQFFEALCDLSGYEGPLHRCDFQGSKHAGKKFEEMLAMGISKPWRQTLNVLTNSTKMSAKSAIRYYKPLLIWLKAENKRLGIKVGWD